MMDEDSDLTSLDELSQEESARPVKKKGKGKAKTKAGEYRLRHALKAPRATTYSTEALYKQIHNGDIDLEPEYQREVVWPESKQIGIIDSIYRNFYIPPVIFAVNVHDDGTEMRTCIDGKQRLTSIHRFVEGLIPHKDSHTGEKLWYRDNPDHRTRTPKKLLSQKYRNLFDGKAVVCVEYQDLEDADEREIFQRVQLGVALTPAEKLKVLATPRAQFVRTLQDDFLNNDASGLGGAALAWDRSRGSDFRCLAQTIQCIAMSPKTTSIQATEKWLADPTPMIPAFAASIENTYRVFETLVRDPRNSKAFAKIAPVEFIMVGMLVHRHKSRLTLEAMGKAVAAMRADVRAEHADIRNNGKVYKTMNAFIDGYKGPAVPRGEICASEAAGMDPARSVGASVSTVKAGQKRKARGAADEDEISDATDADDSDAEYAPAQRATPRKRAAVKKDKAPPAAVPPPTPPASASTGSTSAPPPGSPQEAQGIAVIRAAKERLAAQRAASGGVATQGPYATPTMPSPSLTPFTFNPEINNLAQQQSSFSQQMPSQNQQYGQQQQNAATGIAAALEANLMAAGGWGNGSTPNGPRVKTEPGTHGPQPFSAGSTGSGGYDRYSQGSGSGYGRGSGRGDYSDRERYRRDDDYEYDQRGDKRYNRDRDNSRGGGRRGW
ncbi:hypothetical protein C8F04DRAFT_1063065 [Mycena alexandri]|uniref:GmrSD restriction endonucleases N-terminal domain-containing protein n=1 Tax=Mycena alexandri TaxID=1745969 RepID=A0AAD6TKH1_9AGAR|nr:hypothetical protein C8F04DRAFT_1063065 [Mycena alexandri]